jgi:hypothetical protein
VVVAGGLLGCGGAPSGVRSETAGSATEKRAPVSRGGRANAAAAPDPSGSSPAVAVAAPPSASSRTVSAVPSGSVPAGPSIERSAAPVPDKPWLPSVLPGKGTLCDDVKLFNEGAWRRAEEEARRRIGTLRFREGEERPAWGPERPPKGPGVDSSVWPVSCQSDGGGVWAFLIADATWVRVEEASDPKLHPTATGVLVRITPERRVFLASRSPGLVLSATPAIPARGSRVAEEANCCEEDTWGSTSSYEGMFEVTGDNLPDIVFTETENNEFGMDPSVAFAYSFDGVQVTTTELPGPELKDVDGDGHTDCIGSDVIGLGYESEASGDEVEGILPPYLYHFVPGKGWSTTDEVAREFTRIHCPKAPSTVTVLDDLWCARVWGMSPEETARRAQSKCLKRFDLMKGALSERLLCSGLNERAARVEPPLRLDLPE